MVIRKSIARTAVIWVVLCLWSVVCAAQELTPRFYWPAPKGIKVAVAGYVYATGDVFFDPSIPLYGVDSKVNVAVVGYLQTFSLWGRTTTFLIELPYQWGTTQGLIGDTPARGDAFGFGDIGVTVAVNLLGAPTMTPAQFQELRKKPHPILGASLKVVAPTGQYNVGKLLNVGGNRWAVRAELGSVIPLRPKWLLELDLGAWFLGDDEDFIAGYREQEPIYAFQAHLVRRFKPGFWASLDFNYYTGGRQTIAGNELVDVQNSSRIGGTVVVPFKGRHAVKVGYATGLFAEFGTDFDQFLVSYQLLLNRIKPRRE
jgi:hypothetical protein